MEESKLGKRIGLVIRITLTVALFVFIGALIFRMWQASHKALKDTYITQGFKAAYAVSDDVRTHAVNDEFSENGAVYAYSLVYIEEGGYLQLTVRYNIRHIDEVQLSYPDFKAEDIYYQLADGQGKVYEPTILASEEKFNYRYFKMEFTNVDFSTESLKIKMILGDLDINVGEKSTLAIHYKDDTYIPYQLSSKEKKQLD